MNLAVISFTKTGGLLCGKLTKRLRELGHTCYGYVQPRFLNALAEPEEVGLCPVTGSITEWTKERFAGVDGLIYIGAAGIAVRGIAPFLNDKMTDPAVVVVDEKGRFAISLLSGHVGGANGLTRLVADVIGASPVITTATDVNQKTAIDVWARERGLVLSDRSLAKATAAALLEGEPVGFYSDYPLAEPIPAEFISGELCRLQVWITTHLEPEADHMDTGILRLVPRVLTVGVGCRKGILPDQIWRKLQQVFQDANLDLRAIAGIASLDLKQQEIGIIEIAKRLQVPFITYDTETLMAISGSITSSAFVQEITGIDNVCERAALAGAGEAARLLVNKQAGDGITIAVAEKQRIII